MTPQPSPEEARAALADAAAKSAGVERRLESPWWYDLSLAAIMAGFVLSQAAPLPFNLFIVAGGLLALAYLVSLYKRRYGIWVSGYRAGRTRLVTICLAVLCGGAVIAAAIAKLAYGAAWVAFAGAAFAFIAVLVGSRLWIAAYRAETGTR